MDRQGKALASAGIVVGAVLAGAAVIVVGNNIGTEAERCDRIWNSSAASAECHQRIADGQAQVAAARDAEFDRSMANAQRSIDQNRANIDAASRALRELEANKP